MNDSLKSRLNEIEPIMAAIEGQPVYVVLSSEPGLTIGHNCGGFACGGLSGLFEAKLTRPERSLF